MSFRSRTIQSLGIVVAGLIVVGANTFVVAPARVQAAAFYTSTADLRVGQITDKRRDGLYIDRMAYDFHHDLTLTDDEGRPRELKDFETGSEVKFQLKQGRLALL